MKIIERVLQKQIELRWDSGKVVLVLGPRQVGKTTLIENFCKRFGDYLYINGDDVDNRTILEDAGEARIRQIIGNNKLIFIDEAQRIKNIGIILKIIHDRLKDVRVLVSGSSALEINNILNEPLTGRKWEYNLFPISWQELNDHFGYLEATKQLETRLIYGMYPEVVTHTGDEKNILKQLTGSYLYKDLLAYEGIRKPDLLDKLLVALALQVGSEVSYNELSQLLRIDRATVEQYISLLEKAFVVFRLNPFSRNLRNEINSSRKIYFFDNGIRNAVINNFNPLQLRQDTGALWENFMISERLKFNIYNEQNGRNYFWRTYQQQEIDYIEDHDGKISAFEFKWNPNAKSRFSRVFTDAYSEA
nr:ATP-binding protein [Spirosomataceae bacterium]